MSLRLKFGVLLGLLGLAVLLAVGASGWTIWAQKSDIREPLRSMAGVLRALSSAKASIENQRLLLRSSGSAPPARGTTSFDKWADEIAPQGIAVSPFSASQIAEFDASAASALAALRSIDIEDWKIRSGTTALGNLTARVRESQRLGRRVLHAWPPEPPFTGITPSQYRDAWLESGSALDGLHNLIERIEDQVAAETRSALTQDDHHRALLLAVSGWAVAVFVLSATLGMVLFRRWVIQPVQGIRTAASRLAQGDFDYRIPIGTAGDSRGDELVRLSAEVNHMAGMVKTMQDERVERERFAALGEMLGRLAHNLRNPLAGIRGLAEMTRTELRAPEPAGADIREYQERIISAVDRFEKWLNELLTDTKPMSVAPEPTPVVPWLVGLVDAHQPMARTLGVALTLDTQDAPSEATFDSRYLEHALSAILSNAIEATSSPQARGDATTGGAVRVSVAGHESGQSGQAWTIAIGDQGHGVPPDLRESIFRPYFTTKRGGNGIGLALAMQVVKAHGGQIRVESPNPSVENRSGAAENGHAGGKGTRFTITLPKHGPVLANNLDADMAKNGRSGALGGQNPRHRR